MKGRMILGLALLALVLLPATASAQGVLFVKSNNVGIGKSDPTVKLDVAADGGGSAVTVLKLTNNGFPQFFLTNTATGDQWQMSAFAQAFNISLAGSGGNEFQVFKTGALKAGPGSSTVFESTASGNLIIAGTLTQGSSREIKENFAALDSQDVLQAVSALPLSTWSYKGESDRHVGPMAEDFHQAFGLGQDDKHLAPGDAVGVALAAIQGLNEVVETKNAEIDELRTRLEALEQLLKK